MHCEYVTLPGMQTGPDSTRWLLLRAAVVAGALFAVWLLVNRDLSEAGLLAAGLAAVELLVGFGFRSYRKRRPLTVADLWDAPYED